MEDYIEIIDYKKRNLTNLTGDYGPDPWDITGLVFTKLPLGIHLAFPMERWVNGKMYTFEKVNK